MLTHHDLIRLTPATAPFSRPGWIFELKYDGFRALGIHESGAAKLLTRNGNDLCSCFPEIAHELVTLPEMVIDGELVILDEDGRTQFDRLSRRARLKRPEEIAAAARDEPAAVVAFDLLEVWGEDLRDVILIRRKALLQEVLVRGKRIRYVDHVETEGERLFQLAEKLGLEGIVGKRADSLYSVGRTKSWVKIKTSAGRRAAEDRRHGMRGAERYR